MAEEPEPGGRDAPVARSAASAGPLGDHALMLVRNPPKVITDGVGADAEEEAEIGDGVPVAVWDNDWEGGWA